MIKTKKYPTQEELKQLFHYDGSNLIWKENRGTNKVKGIVAGYIEQHKKYAYIRINNETYPAHRLIWIYNYGEIPYGYQIDHLNHNRSDNRLCNLRMCTSLQNRQNLSLVSYNTSGITGVSWSKLYKKWVVKISVNNKTKHFGSFDNKADAYVRYKWVCKKYKFHSNHGKVI